MSDGGFEIRLARAGELREVGELTVRAYSADGLLDPSESYADRLRDAADRAREAELWVAVEQPSGPVLGSATFCPLGSPYRELATDTEAEFRMLAVDPSARGRGVGRALVETMVRRAREQEFTGVVLCSLTTMLTAQHLYTNLGFRRDRDLDWSPTEDVTLLGFRRDL